MRHETNGGCDPVTFLAYSLSQCAPLSMSGRIRRQAPMSSRFHQIACAAAMFAMLVLSSQASAQSDDVDPEIRIQQLENRLRQLTGQNEELQYRNRQLEDRLRSLQGGAPGAPIGQPAVSHPNMAAAAPPAQPYPPLAQQQDPQGYNHDGYGQHIAPPAPIAAESQAGPPAPQGRFGGDTIGLNQNTNARGAP